MVSGQWLPVTLGSNRPKPESKRSVDRRSQLERSVNLQYLLANFFYRAASLRHYGRIPFTAPTEQRLMEKD